MDKSISDVLFFHNNSSRNEQSSSLLFDNDDDDDDDENTFKSGNLAWCDGPTRISPCVFASLRASGLYVKI